MKKTSNCGFVLLETLVVTVFISGVLVFLFTQFTSLNRKYEESYNYNAVEDIYALSNIYSYIKEDEFFYNQIVSNLDGYINIKDCEFSTNIEFCKKLFEYEEIDALLVTKNKFDKSDMIDFDEDIMDFIDKIQPKGSEKYRLIAKFKHNVKAKILDESDNSYKDKTFEYYTFATIRFGDNNE